MGKQKEKVIYREVVRDKDGNDVETLRTVYREVPDVERFYRAYSDDIGALMKCTKAERNVIDCCMKLKFIGFETNEIILYKARRQDLCACAGISQASLYNFISSLKKKSIIVEKDARMYLNPLLFFFGHDATRNEFLKLTIIYRIRGNEPEPPEEPIKPKPVMAPNELVEV